MTTRWCTVLVAARCTLAAYLKMLASKLIGTLAGVHDVAFYMKTTTSQQSGSI
jgi:hypothetical protein